MKAKFLLISILFIINSCTQKPDAKNILKKSFEKCQTIENGYYEMEHHMKYLSKKDTAFQTYKCYFKKLQEDSLFPSAFHYQMFSDTAYIKNAIYTGNDLVSYSTNDSTGRIMSKKRWAKKIKALSHNYTFYSPFVDKESYPLPNDSTLQKTTIIFEYVGDETINGVPCYHIKMNVMPENDPADMMKTLRAENNYWISKRDYIPIQYSIAYDLEMNNDTMYQFEKNILTKYEINNLKNEKELNLSSIPSYVNLKDYKPYKAPELLPNNTIAPDWTLTSIKDKTIHLSDFKGKLVLIDFFYKSCYPCMLALPELQDLHEKYNTKGLVVIGIDPYDSKEKDDMELFLKKRGITYTVLLEGNDVAKQYHVSAYPTVYLIDKNGKIIFSRIGYDETLNDVLEKAIKENL